MRLTAKLSFVQFGFALAVLLGTLLPVYFSEQRHLLKQAGHRQVAEVEQFARVCGQALRNGDDAAPLAYLKTLVFVSQPGAIAYAVFFDANGRVLLHSDFLHGDMTLKGRRPDGDALLRALEAPGGLRQAGEPAAGAPELLSTPVFFSRPRGPERAGTAVVAFDRAAVEATLGNLQRESLGRVAEVALPGLGLALLLALLLAQALTRPIQELGAGARLIGQGRLKTRIALERGDELGDLAREFNAMAAKLAELDALKDNFLAQITHDLRNPLSAIVAYVDLVRMGVQGTLNEEQAKSLRIAAESSGYLNELIGNILEITKMEAGRMAFKPEPIAFAELVSEVFELFHAKAGQFGVTLDSDGVAASASVLADREALKRVLINLVSNALKFTPEGGTIRVSLSTDGGLNRVEVSDTGIGVPADKLDTLFRKFSQIDETKNKVREAQGTGLGLVICKQIVEAHGGTIGVESVYRKGTTFHFTLPRSVPAESS